MYCNHCGKPVADEARLCVHCGWAISVVRERPHKLRRSRSNRKIAGVCGGIAEFFGLNPATVRIVWLLLGLAYGCGVVAYVIAWIAIPRAQRPSNAPRSLPPGLSRQEGLPQSS